MPTQHSSRRPLLSSWTPFFLLAALPLAAAQGDYTCTSTSDCPAYAAADATGGPYPVSANMQCVSDPLQPSYGYCGYAGAACTVNSDCDYGSCSSGKCTGYLGTVCTKNSDCMGFFMCGGGYCGGTNAVCQNGNQDCMSGSCSAASGTGVCSAPPAAGGAVGSGCSTNSNCASGTTCQGYICKTSTAAAAGASQGSRMRFKRAGTPHERIARAMSSAFLRGRSVAKTCPPGQTACAMGTSSLSSNLGFECIDTTNTLESCGGCLPVPGFTDVASAHGVDCTALPNVADVICDTGLCLIRSCMPGTEMASDGLGCI